MPENLRSTSVKLVQAARSFELYSAPLAREDAESFFVKPLKCFGLNLPYSYRYEGLDTVVVLKVRGALVNLCPSVSTNTVLSWNLFTHQQAKFVVFPRSLAFPACCCTFSSKVTVYTAHLGLKLSPRGARFLSAESEVWRRRGIRRLLGRARGRSGCEPGLPTPPAAEWEHKKETRTRCSSRRRPQRQHGAF